MGKKQFRPFEKQLLRATSLLNDVNSKVIKFAQYIRPETKPVTVDIPSAEPKTDILSDKNQADIEQEIVSLDQKISKLSEKLEKMNYRLENIENLKTRKNLENNIVKTDEKLRIVIETKRKLEESLKTINNLRARAKLEINSSDFTE